ncbi:hypothetical protein EIZ47_04045 [Chryseobacterium lacus]|uniref:Uncharacterized protein n=1 Tax=Chryseobacterium lacus TaxID=2058346 RepID=A0A368N1D2_9FLAO|nr:hypothetical protein [Chryseobacterium lacus]RCU43355.1 hypothetical protein DQ356_04085 [Chryseobacterium lacus]RST28367.1 hypothetical protein EIZ47_04045 [Chryseobacterium lacus]
MKRIINYTGLLFLLLLILNSCRQDEMVAEAQQQSEKVSKFGIFSNKKEGSLARENDMHYQEGFRYLYSSYYELYPEEAPDFEDASKPLVDFRFASQVFYEEDSSKYVLFPIVHERRVIDIMVGHVNRDETYVEFYYAEKDDLVELIINEFAEHAGGVISGEENPPQPKETLIQEVVIIVPKAVKPVKQSLFIDTVDYAHLPPGGDCTLYGNCGGGGNSNPVMPQPQTQPSPCAKSKSISQNADRKALLEFLKGKATSATVEHAYLIPPNEPPLHLQGDYASGQIQISLNGQIDSMLHSHYQGLLSVFSVSDIFAVASLYQNGGISNVGTFTFGVVTASGTQYLLVIDNPTKFSNFASNLLNSNGGYDSNSVNMYQIIYDKYNINESNSPAMNEAAFVRFLEATNSGLKALKGTSDFNNWQVLNKNANGTVTPQNCN